MTADPMLTVAEVAEQLKRTEEFVRNEIHRKHLRAAKIGRHFNVSPADLAAYIEDRMNRRAS